MSPASGIQRIPPAALAAVLRDPLVPLDLGGWLRRTGRVLRRDYRILLALSGVLTLLTVGVRIVVELTSPTYEDIGRQLYVAGSTSPDGFVDRWTVFRIAYVPLIPAFVTFVVLLAVVNGICSGAAFYRAVRQANGQPTPLIAALRATRPRVLPFIGWYLLAVLGTALAVIVLLVTGTITNNRWLSLIGVLIAAPLITVAAIVFLPTIFGVVFLERRGLRRCLQLVSGRFWLAGGRTVVAGGVIGLYSAAVAALIKLLPRPFGGPDPVLFPYSPIAYLVDGLLHLPLFGLGVAASLVTYVELRFREDPTTSTATLAREVPV